MVYPINVVINDRNWYDSRIIESDPVVFQNVNYADGDDRSVNIVRQRFIQDWARRLIPNSIRQGVGLTDPAGGSDEIVITQGYAIVGGRFLDIPAGTFDAGNESVSTGLNYLMIRVATFTEGDTRDPSAATASIVAVLVGSYTKSHNDLVIAKFNYTGTVVNQFEDYTSEQEWQTNVISPPAARPGLTTAPTEEILFRAGAIERVDILNIEADKVRFYLNAVFDDQTAREVKLINNSGILETRNVTDTAYLGQDMLNLLVGGTERIDSSGNLLNIGTINTGTIGGDSISADIVDRGSTQTLTNKTLTSPIITGGTLNAGAALTVDSTELNQLDAVDVGGNTSGDIITTDDTQTMTNKTMTTPVIATLYQDAGLTNLITFPSSSQTMVGLTTTDTLQNKTLKTLVVQDTDQSNTGTISLPNLTGDRIYSITQTVSDDFVMKNETQTLTNKSISTSQIDSGILTVLRGGSGAGTFTDGGILLGSGTGALTATSRPTAAQLLIGQSSGDPIPTTLSGGDITLTQAGVMTVVNDSHTHNTQYYTETETDILVLSGSGNAEWVTLSFQGGLDISRTDVSAHGSIVDIGTSTGSNFSFALTGMPYNRGTESLRVARLRVTVSGNATNYVIGVTDYWVTTSGQSNGLNHISGTIGEGGVESQIMDITDKDLGSILRWGILLATNTDNAFSPEMRAVEAEVYYA
jgi:hypothetical protein